MKIKSNFLLESEIQNRFPDGLDVEQLTRLENHILNIFQQAGKINLSAVSIIDDIYELDQFTFEFMVGKNSISVDYDLKNMEPKVVNAHLPGDMDIKSKEYKLLFQLGAFLFDNEPFWQKFKSILLEFFNERKPIQ